MRRVCVYHAGCPDGFGAAWATWQVWGDPGTYLPRGHEDPLDPRDFAGDRLLFVDIAPPVARVRELADAVERLIVLDHHVSSRDRYEADPELLPELESFGHRVLFDLDHSGAALAWQHFHPDEPMPELLSYVQDQDLWRWKLPNSREVNAALRSYPRRFDTWSELAAAPIAELVAQGEPIVRAERVEVERALDAAHAVSIGELRVEAVNARDHRSLIGHELASRAAFGVPCGAVYRITGTRVDVSIYAVGDFDVAAVAGSEGGGGHRSAAGFSVPLADWLDRFV